jgi:heme oxygenase
LRDDPVSQIDRLSVSPPREYMRAPQLLARLRTETRAAHDRIEASPALCCLLSPALEVEPYVRALRALHAFHARMWVTLPALLQDFLAPFTSAGGSFAPNTAGLDALADDIAWFGASPAAPMAAMEPLNDAASALGALYVVEGSALGARVIGRSVSVSLGVVPGRGGSFFCGATADIARTRWNDFSDLLGWAETRLGQAGAARVVGGALGVFDRLEQEFDRHSATPCFIQLPVSAQKVSSAAQAARILN